MVDFPFIKIDVFTDAGYKVGQLSKIGTVSTWDELKTIITFNIKGQTILGDDTKFANIALKIHTYNVISTIELEQDTDGHYNVIFRNFADPSLVSALETFLNS